MTEAPGVRTAVLYHLLVVDILAVAFVDEALARQDPPRLVAPHLPVDLLGGPVRARVALALLLAHLRARQ